MLIMLGFLSRPDVSILLVTASLWRPRLIWVESNVWFWSWRLNEPEKSPATVGLSIVRMGLNGTQFLDMLTFSEDGILLRDSKAAIKLLLMIGLVYDI